MGYGEWRVVVSTAWITRHRRTGGRSCRPPGSRVVTALERGGPHRMGMVSMRKACGGGPPRSREVRHPGGGGRGRPPSKAFLASWRLGVRQLGCNRRPAGGSHVEAAWDVLTATLERGGPHRMYMVSMRGGCVGGPPRSSEVTCAWAGGRECGRQTMAVLSGAKGMWVMPPKRGTASRCQSLRSPSLRWW